MTTTTPSADTTKHAYFMLVRTTADWLRLSPPERFAFVDETIKPLLRRNPAVTMRYFDSEAFNSRVTDVILWETTEILAYQRVVEELRETRFWGTYFGIVEIVAAIEDAYASQYDVAAYGKP